MEDAEQPAILKFMELVSDAIKTGYNVLIFSLIIGVVALVDKYSIISFYFLEQLRQLLIDAIWIGVIIMIIYPFKDWEAN